LESRRYGKWKLGAGQVSPARRTFSTHGRAMNYTETHLSLNTVICEGLSFAEAGARNAAVPAAMISIHDFQMRTC